MSQIQFNLLNRRSVVSGYRPTGLKSGEIFIQMADNAILFNNDLGQTVCVTTPEQFQSGSFVTTGQTGQFASLDGSNYLKTTQIPNITGDVCINAGSNVSTVYKIQGQPVANTQPAVGQTLQFNGSSWVPGDIPAGGNGGGGLVYYFNETVAADLPTGNLPASLSGTFELGRTGISNQFSVVSNTLSQVSYDSLVGFVTDVLDPSATSIPAGLFDFNIWASSNTATQTVLQLKVFKYNGSTTTATLLATSDDVYTYDGTVISQYILSVVLPQTTLTSTDRLYIQILAKALGTNKTVTLYFGGNTPSHVHTTIPSVGGSGLVKVINGVMQNPAALLVDADVSASAAIAGSKIQSGFFALASATGSFVTTGQTGVFALSSQTGNFITTSQTGQFASTGHTHTQYVSTGSTGAFVTTGQTGVFALAANTGAFVTTGQTGNFASSGHVHVNYVSTGSTGSFITTGQTGSFSSAANAIINLNPGSNNFTFGSSNTLIVGSANDLLLGGSSNCNCTSASTYSTIINGSSNYYYGNSYSTIVGSANSANYGNYGLILGGCINVIGADQVNSIFNTVINGSGNWTYGSSTCYSTIINGSGNSIRNSRYTTIIGGVGIQVSGAVNTTYTNNLCVTGGVLSVGPIEENITVCSAATSGLINFDVIPSATMYYLNNSTSNFYLNLRANASTSVDSILETNKTLTVTFLNTNGATGYALTGISIDGTGRSIKWLNGTGSYPAGNTGSIDSYSITAVKTGGNSYIVLASQGKFI